MQNASALLGVCRPITGGEHTPGCSVYIGRMRHRQHEDMAKGLIEVYGISYCATYLLRKVLRLTYNIVMLN